MNKQLGYLMIVGLLGCSEPKTIDGLVLGEKFYQKSSITNQERYSIMIKVEGRKMALNYFDSSAREKNLLGLSEGDSVRLTPSRWYDFSGWEIAKINGVKIEKEFKSK